MESTSAAGRTPISKNNSGVLVALSGRRRGHKRRLREAMTFVGSSETCDLRLEGLSVDALHCLIAQTAEGPRLRDLDSSAGTMVNGRQVTSALLHHGDVLVIGQAQFRMELIPKSNDTAATDHLQNNHDDVSEEALRIQAAAVAAQQVALTERELLLAKRETTLEKQQSQLAAHLEDKRQRLMELFTKTQSARNALKNDREAYQRQADEVSRDLSQMQLAVLDEKKNVAQRRSRLAKLRRRLKRRFDRTWESERQRLKKNERLLEETCRHLEQQQIELQTERQNLSKTCIKFNTDVEIGRRRLEYEWGRLNKERSSFESQAVVWYKLLIRREDELVAAENCLQQKKITTQCSVEVLAAQARGLGRRNRNQRRIIAEQQKEIAQLEKKKASLTGAAPVDRVSVESRAPERRWPLALPIASEHAIEHWLFEAGAMAPGSIQDHENSVVAQETAALEELAGTLADQRRCLAAQWESFLTAREEWRRDRRILCTQIVSILTLMKQHAQGMQDRERRLDIFIDEVQERHDELMHLRKHLLGWQARLQAREVNWDAVQEKALAEVAGREAAVKKQLKTMDGFLRQWSERQRNKLDALVAEQRACEKAQQEYAGLAEKRRTEVRRLQADRHALVAKAMALEQYRQKIVRRSADSADAEIKISRLQNRLDASLARQMKTADWEREQLQEEIHHLQEFCKALHQRLEKTQSENARYNEQYVQNQEYLLSADREQSQMMQQLQVVREQLWQSEQQIRLLQDEIEQVSRGLMDEPQMPALLLRANDRVEDTEPAAIDRAA